jgi:hypothetical protein
VGRYHGRKLAVRKGRGVNFTMSSKIIVIYWNISYSSVNMKFAMKVYVNSIIGLVLTVLLLSLSACRVNKSTLNDIPGTQVEVEEVVYNYVNPNNGSGPFWCRGSPILVRNNEDVFVSGIETLNQYQPVKDKPYSAINNLRWMLYKRETNGWKLQQADEKDRTREPSPIGILSDGRLVMSVNPTLDKDPNKAGTSNQPRILEFSVSDPKAPYKTLLPEWKDNPPFTEHSYRTFSVDRENNEYILFQNISSLYAEWAFRHRTGKWTTGQLQWLPRVNDPIPPFDDKNLRLVYPVVVLKNREVHFCGNAAINQWSRIHNMEDAKKFGIEDIQGLGGRIAGMRFRRIYYTWTPDITQNGFSTFLEIANSYENGESIRVEDMWADRGGVVHLLWHKNPIYKEIRDKNFPDIKRVWSINYVRIKKGEILLKSVLLETGDGVKVTPFNDLLKDYSISQCRFQILPDDRLFVIFHISGRNKSGELTRENRIMEVYSNGSAGMSAIIPMKSPMSTFFTATPRGGSLPSKIIDLVGSSDNVSGQVQYAKIKMND